VSWRRRHRYLLPRRLCQAGILFLFWLGARQHLDWFSGNLSSATLFRSIPLTDPYAALQILATGRGLAGTALLGAAIVLIFYLVVGGRSFCAWVCPINPVTDLAGWLRSRLRVERTLRVPRETRTWILALSLVLSALLGVAAFEWVSPIAMVHRELIFGAGLGLLAIGWIFLLDLLLVRNGWCGSLCPLGAFWALAGRFAVVRLGFARERCDRCGDCVQVCSEAHVIRFEEIGARGFIDDGDCLNCARCLEVCPRDAFAFTSRFHPRRNRDPVEPRREVDMRANPKYSVCILALLSPLFLMGADSGAKTEVDDGIDVYFRDVDLSALSGQDLAVYIDAEPGEGELIDRSFPDAPPLISHTVEGMPITRAENECLDCHHPANITEEDEVPMSDSHFEIPIMVAGKKNDPLRWKVKGYEKSDDMAQARFNCTMCHAPQATNVRTPSSTFVREKLKPAK
jgi:ferredoxin-type protein NapH